MSAIEERRSRAIQAAQNVIMRPRPNGDTGLHEAIEVATQVRITDETIHAAIEAGCSDGICATHAALIIAAALKSLGFEVI